MFKKRWVKILITIIALVALKSPQIENRKDSLVETIKSVENTSIAISLTSKLKNTAILIYMFIVAIGCSLVLLTLFISKKFEREWDDGPAFCSLLFIIFGFILAPGYCMINVILI